MQHWYNIGVSNDSICFIQSKKYSKSIKKYKRIEKFNRERLKYAKRFTAYITSWVEDDVPFKKIRGSFLVDLYAVEKKFAKSD